MKKRAQDKLWFALALFGINQRAWSAVCVYLGSAVDPGTPAALPPPLTHSLRQLCHLSEKKWKVLHLTYSGEELD